MEVGKQVLRSAERARADMLGSKFFRRKVREAFQKVDLDQSNSLDPTEVYCAVLLFYTMIIPYIYTATPPDKDFVLYLVHQIDIDKSGDLSLEEFESLAALLFSHLFKRLIFEFTLTLIIAPVLATLMFSELDTLAIDYFQLGKDSLIVSVVQQIRNTFVIVLLITTVAPFIIKRMERKTQTRALLLNIQQSMGRTHMKTS